MTFPHLKEVLCSEALVQVLHTDRPYGGQRRAELLGDLLGVGEVLDLCVDPGGEGVRTPLQLLLHLPGGVVIAENLILRLPLCSPRLPEISQ